MLLIEYNSGGMCLRKVELLLNIPPLLIVLYHDYSLDQKCGRSRQGKGHFPKAIFSPPSAAQQLYSMGVFTGDKISISLLFAKRSKGGKKINHAPCAKKYDCALIDLCYMQFVRYFLL